MSPATFKSPPTFKSLIIPTPPDTVRAPVVVDEEAVRSFSLTPATSKVLIAALFS
jgi:hypothetical protein